MQGSRSPVVLAVAVMLVGLVFTAPQVRAQHHRSVSMPGPTQHYPVWRGGDSSLPDHTILRPANLDSVPYRLPIVVWGNGGCRPSNQEFHYFLTTLASYGVFVIANGNPGVPYDSADWTGLVQPKPQLLTEAVGWAVKQNATRGSIYHGRLDTRRVAVMGQSCGGWEATDASSDSRVGSTIIWNSSTNPYHPQGILQLHAPTLFAYGGPLDQMSAGAIASYHLTSEPAVLIANSAAEHTLWWDDPTDGSPTPSPLQRQPLMVASQWLAFTLYHAVSGKQFFLGANCGLCKQPGWTVESRNWS